jgi:hypothetical protein
VRARASGARRYGGTGTVVCAAYAGVRGKRACGGGCAAYSARAALIDAFIDPKSSGKNPSSSSSSLGAYRCNRTALGGLKTRPPRNSRWSTLGVPLERVPLEYPWNEYPQHGTAEGARAIRASRGRAGRWACHGTDLGPFHSGRSHLGHSHLGPSHFGPSHFGPSHFGPSHLGRSHLGRSHLAGPRHGLRCTVRWSRVPLRPHLRDQVGVADDERRRVVRRLRRPTTSQHSTAQHSTAHFVLRTVLSITLCREGLF